MTTEPLAGTVLTFDLADSSGTLLATSWIGSMNFTVGALSFGYTYNNAYGIWCPHPLMTPGTCGQSTFRLTIDFPNTARAKTITGLNLGSWNGTYKHGSANTNGYNPSTTAWPSLRVNLLNNTTAGQKFTISIFGKNIY
jgi:hypothetical protein